MQNTPTTVYISGFVYESSFSGFYRAVFFPERLGEGRFLGAVSLSSLT